MITDDETNYVYFSGYLNKYLSEQARMLSVILDENNIGFSFLKSTKDYFCRDYMPVQVQMDKFVQFVFYPISYFKKNEYSAISNQVRIILDNNLTKPTFSRLILDGGNVVKAKDKVIITDKVFDDNQYQLSHIEILHELEKLFGAEIIIVPAIPGDYTGHADGMLRFINNDTLLINALGIEDQNWETKFLKVLNDHRLHYEEFPVFGVDATDGAIGIYINFLHVGNLIVLPIFDHPKQQNDEALNRISELYPSCSIIPVNANQIALEGGVLNCCTWNIKV